VCGLYPAGLPSGKIKPGCITVRGLDSPSLHNAVIDHYRRRGAEAQALGAWREAAV